MTPPSLPIRCCSLDEAGEEENPINILSRPCKRLIMEFWRVDSGSSGHSSSVDRASAFWAAGREFDPLLWLHTAAIAQLEERLSSKQVVESSNLSCSAHSILFFCITPCFPRIDSQGTQIPIPQGVWNAFSAAVSSSKMNEMKTRIQTMYGGAPTTTLCYIVYLHEFQS